MRICKIGEPERILTIAFAILVVSLCAATGIKAADSPGSSLLAGKNWWAHIEYLAGDELQGRLTGSEGYNRGAEYVAARFKEYGLNPAGLDGYYQQVRFDVQRTLADQSSVSLVSAGPDTKVEPLAIGQELLLGSRSPQPKRLEASLVFIGYGLHLPDAHYDDFAGENLKGKVLVYINGGPSEISAALKSDARGSEFNKAVDRSGAVGTISLLIPRAMDIPWPRLMKLASQTGMRLAATDLQDSSGEKLSATFNPEFSEKLFVASGHTFAEILALAEAGKPLPRFPMAVKVRASIAMETHQVESPNLVAELPGSDPTLQKEYVALSAHLDHLGVGEPVNDGVAKAGDAIYHGAMDDASGVASVLEIARFMQSSHVLHRRSILFVIFTGEEKGLLGSRYFATHPTVPQGSIVADLNMDMPLPLFPFKYLLSPGLEESTLSAEAHAEAAARGIQVIADPYPDRNTFIRTDQYSFVRIGVPAVALKFGFLVGSPEQKIETDWRHQRYHSPGDNLSQPVDLEAAASFDEFVMSLAERVANDEKRPQWVPGSFFRRFEPEAHHQ